MKTSPWAALSAAVFAAFGLFPDMVLAASGNGNSGSTASTIPSIPTGALSAFPTIVQTGTKPTLTWSIMYPSKVSDVAVINPPGSITLTDQVYVSVQPIGTGVTACDPTQGVAPVYTDLRMSVNGSSFFQLFYGIQSDIQPAYSLYIKKLAKNTVIDFGGRYVKNGAWTPFYTTRSSNLQVIALVNGDTPPTSFTLYQSPTLAGYLKPYLDATGKVKIGPMSVLILMELGQTNHAANCFDYQDQVVLVTFSTKHPNNGHGNNLDGVDSSNPGKGKGGPNGAVDPSGGVDDEAR
jgi:hypothetical protein